MHPSKDIVASKGSELQGLKIVICITGSAAAFKCPDLARELMRHGADVHVVMTATATRFIHPSLMEWATGNPVTVELTGKAEHISLAGEHKLKADLVLVAPSTANTIGKAAHGIADTSVTTVILTAMGSGIPILIVPAMHSSLYKSPINQENIEKLKRIGVEFIEPRWEEGKAKFPEIDIIVKKVIERLSAPNDLSGLKVLVTAGPTREPLDAIRFLTNPSTGRMGLAIAEEALSRGADVTLIHGPGLNVYNPRLKTLKVVTTEQMLNAVVSELKGSNYDIIVLAAAPLDFGFEKPVNYKISSSVNELHVILVAKPKISLIVRKYAPTAFFIGFKAEFNLPKEALIESAYAKLKEAGMNLIVANDVSKPGCGFSSETNEVYIVDEAKNVVHIPLTSKRVIAKKLLDLAISRLKGRR
ncbi:MAG: bifunctional phosphopantothenoylcysteine decarboxylase/phosphopantothenate--cysteine ligase CoaBC [Candidatus Nezhaarchaeales archaeon]